MGEFDNWDINFNTEQDNEDNFSSNNDMGDFGAEAQTADEVSSDKASIVKQAIIIIVIGAILALLTFCIIREVKGGSDKPKDTVKNNQTTQEEVVNNNQSNNTNSSNNTNHDAWASFKSDDSIYFDSDFISSTFNITDIKHYVKVLEVENSLMVKTVLTGTLDGFRGTYELEVPYSKGCQLSTGKSFHVEVQQGSYGDNKVVGEIKY